MIFVLIVLYKESGIKNLPLVVFLMGPTASGKTDIAIELSQQERKVDIISVDSALVYRDMNIGTAKPIPSELKIAPHKLIDIRDPHECYSVANFYHDVNKELEKIIQFGRIPLLVGGTMLYFKILLQGLFIFPKANQLIREDIHYEAQKFGWHSVFNKLKCIDPLAANMIHFNDHKRITRALEIFLISGKTWTELRLNSLDQQRIMLSRRILQFAIIPESWEVLKKRIVQRFYLMLENGFENEVRMLFARPELHQSVKPSMLCAGYRQMWEYLSGNISYDRMIVTAICATKQVAKRQLTWLRNWPNLHWLNSSNLSTAIDSIIKILN